MRARGSIYAASLEGVFVVLAVVTLVGLAAAHPSFPWGPVSWWRAEGNALDSQDGNDGELEPGVGFGSGIAGEAFRFSGMDGDGGVDLGDVPAFDFDPSGSFTIEAWVNSLGATNAPNDGQTVLALNYDCGPTLQVLGISIDGPEAIFFQVRDSEGSSSGPLFGPTLSKGQWHHVAAVRRVANGAATLRLYVDGVRVAGPVEDLATGTLALHVPDLIGRRNVCGTTNTLWWDALPAPSMPRALWCGRSKRAPCVLRLRSSPSPLPCRSRRQPSARATSHTAPRESTVMALT